MNLLIDKQQTIYQILVIFLSYYQFILNDNKTQIIVTTQASASRSQHYNRENIINSLTYIKLTFKLRYIVGKIVNVNTEEFKLVLM